MFSKLGFVLLINLERKTEPGKILSMMRNSYANMNKSLTIKARLDCDVVSPQASMSYRLWGGLTCTAAWSIEQIV